MLNINITAILKNMLVPLVESYWPALILMLMGGILLYVYRYDLTDTYRERKKYTERALYIIVIPSIILLGYLFLTESYWILSFLFAGMVYYILDYLGLLPSLISLRKEYY